MTAEKKQKKADGQMAADADCWRTLKRLAEGYNNFTLEGPAEMPGIELSECWWCSVRLESNSESIVVKDATAEGSVLGLLKALEG